MHYHKNRSNHGCTRERERERERERGSNRVSEPRRWQRRGVARTGHPTSRYYILKSAARASVRVLHFIRAVPCNNLRLPVRVKSQLYTRSFTMDKSESIMIRTRQKWRRHQTHRHLPSGRASFSSTLVLSSPLSLSLLTISRGNPPRGNRDEARRTFRLITVLQFNE